jgi:hypothetical protein
MRYGGKLNWPDSLLTAALGVVLLVAGVALLSIPAALIVAGLAPMAAAVPPTLRYSNESASPAL